jgi:hypothetical protein
MSVYTYRDWKKLKKVINSGRSEINSLDVIERAGDLECNPRLIIEFDELSNLINLKKSLSHLPKWYESVALVRDDYFEHHNNKHDYKSIVFDDFVYWYLEY